MAALSPVRCFGRWAMFAVLISQYLAVVSGENLAELIADAAESLTYHVIYFNGAGIYSPVPYAMQCMIESFLD
jgi:hypothetical protein